MSDIPASYVRYSSRYSICLTRISFHVRTQSGRTVARSGLFLRQGAIFASLLLSKCLVSLLYRCPCPPAHDLGSRVAGLVKLILAIARLIKQITPIFTDAWPAWECGLGASKLKKVGISLNDAHLM